MSFNTMAKSLAAGEIPGVAEVLARNKLNEALGVIYDETDWSFQTRYGQWLAPGWLISAGSVTVYPYSTVVVGDLTATLAWGSLVGRPLITELQFRDPSWSLYNIIEYDPDSNWPNATLTLDRPWMEPTSGEGRPYMIYQALFPAPCADFRKFLWIMDPTQASPVDYWSVSQDDLSVMDPQRLIFGPTAPQYAVPAGIDTRPNSSTAGYILYELWPHVLSRMPYPFAYKRRGDLLVKPDDTVPLPLTEELLTWRTKEVLYQFKEAQKGENVLRGSGANWQFLSEAAHEEYKLVLQRVRAIDANLHRDFVTRGRSGCGRGWRSDGFSTQRLGLLNIGR